MKAYTSDKGLDRLLLAVMLGCVGVWGVLEIGEAPRTPGIHGDAIQYLSAAESFAEHGTFTIPIASWREPLSPSTLSHFPPGFPSLVSAPISLGAEPVTAASWVMAVSAGLGLAFAFLLGAQVAGSWGGAAAALLLLSTPALVRLHAAVWSEPSHLAVTLALLYAMVRGPTRAGLHGLFAAAGLAIRYVGVAGTAAAVVWAVLHARTAGERIRRMGLALTPSLLLGVWWYRYTSAGAGTVRRPGWYSGRLGRDLASLDDLAVDWLVPSTAGGGGWTVAAFLLGAGAVVHLARREGAWSGDEARGVARSALLYSLCYCAVLLASRVLLDPGIPFDVRLLAPVLVLATIVLGASAVAVARLRRGVVAGSIAAVLVTWAVFAWAEIRTGVRVAGENGLYYTHRIWSDGRLGRWVREIPDDVEAIYSNEPELVHFLTGRAVAGLPRASEHEDLEEFRSAFLETPGPVVLAEPTHPDDLSVAELSRAVPLRIALRAAEGMVLLPDPPDAER